MEAEEFDKTKFHGRMQVIYKDQKHDLMSVDFEERLFGFNIETDQDLKWVRCENAQVIDLLKTANSSKSKINIDNDDIHYTEF